MVSTAAATTGQRGLAHKEPFLGGSVPRAVALPPRMVPMWVGCLSL